MEAVFPKTAFNIKIRQPLESLFPNVFVGFLANFPPRSSNTIILKLDSSLAIYLDDVLVPQPYHNLF